VRACSLITLLHFTLNTCKVLVHGWRGVRETSYHLLSSPVVSAPRCIFSAWPDFFALFIGVHARCSQTTLWLSSQIVIRKLAFFHQNSVILFTGNLRANRCMFCVITLNLRPYLVIKHCVFLSAYLRQYLCISEVKIICSTVHKRCVATTAQSLNFTGIPKSRNIVGQEEG